MAVFWPDFDRPSDSDIPLMNLLFKAAAIWILSLVAAGPIPLALHVAICHEHGEVQGRSESTTCSHHDHHSHAGHSHAGHSHANQGTIVLVAANHDHECGVCQTLSQTASIDTIAQECNSQLVVQPSIVALSDVYTACFDASYQVRGPPCSLLV